MYKCKLIKTTDIIILIVLLVILLTYIMIRIFTIKSYSFLTEFAKNKSIQLTTIIINKAIYEMINDSEYDSLMKTKINNDDVIDIDLDNNKINKMLYLVNNNIIKNIYLLENGKYNDLNIDYLSNKDFIFEVPIGIIYDIPILVGIGPKIPFKVDILGNTDNNVYTKIKEYGINNSMIEVVMNINLNVEVILPFTSKEIQISKEIPLDTKIIEGKVPTYYGNARTNSN